MRMSMVFGSFEKRLTGARLAENLNRADRTTTFAIAHGDHLREEEIQLSGTLSLPYAMVGAFIVGCLAAAISWGVVWPMMGVWLPWAALVGFALATAPFGALAGAVAGAAECRTRLSRLAERTESASRTLVTADIPHGRIGRTMRAFTAAGGSEVAVV